MSGMRVLKGGARVTPEGIVQGDLVMDGARIVSVGATAQTAAADEVVDAEGCLVFPGFIDGHVHFDLSTSGTAMADHFATGTNAAACGGTTTVCEFISPEQGDTQAGALSAWHAKARDVSRCNYAFHMSFPEWNPSIAAEIPAMREAGITSFKAYMAYWMRLEDNQMLELLEALKAVGGILGVHCENGRLADELRARELACGNFGPAAHALSRPPQVEAEAIDRFLRIASLADVPVNVVHLSTALGLEVIREARARGQRVYAETCPQYLLLDDSFYELPGFEGAKYVMSPPLRKPTDIVALREAVVAGEIDTIGTDHCAFNYYGQKEQGRGDFTKIPNGAPGVEHRPALMSTLFHDDLEPVALCRLMSENPARIFGMYPRKGALQAGADADICVWDPRAEWTIRAAEQQQNVDYTPYEGRRVQGRAHLVYVMGQLAACDGKPTGVIAGRYVSR